MNTQGTNPRFIVAMIVILVVIVAGLLFYSLNLNKKNSELKKQAQQTSNPATTIVRDGVFLSFSATAQGKVTKITNDSIEIEAEDAKESFKLSQSVFITHNFSVDSLLRKVTDRLIGTVYAQTATSSPKPSQPSAAPAAAVSALPPAPPVATSGGQPFVQKSIKDVKVGTTVMLNLTKQKEADEWVVTSIFIQP